MKLTDLDDWLDKKHKEEDFRNHLKDLEPTSVVDTYNCDYIWFIIYQAQDLALSNSLTN